MLHVIVTQVTKHDEGMIPVTVTVTQSYDTEKDIEGFRIDNII